MRKSMMRYLALGLVLAAGVVWACNPPGGPTSPPGKGGAGGGDPVNLFSGDEYRHIEDLTLWGGVGQHRLSWERWAHSRATKGSLWFGRGHNWRHSYQWEIASAGVTTNGAAKLQINYPDGAVYTFVQLGETAWESPTACPDILGQDGDDFLLQRANGWQYHIVRHYTAQGAAYYLLEDFMDAQGNIYTLTYNTARRLTKVTEPAGRWLTIQYGKVTMSQGASNTPVNIFVVTNVVASDGRQVAYTYAPYTDVALPYTYQVLSSVTYAEGVQAHYEYTLARPGTRPLVARWDDPHYRLPLPRSRTEYSTDTNAAWGVVLRQFNDQTGEVLMEAGKYNGSVNIPMAIYPRQGTNLFKMVKEQKAWEKDGLGRQISYGYDTNGFQNVITDPLKRTTRLVNSSFGNPLQVTHPDGTVAQWGRDDLDLPVQYTDELGRVTTYTRDARHRITQVTYADGTIETFVYNDWGQITTHQLRNGGSIQATYDATGRLTAMTDPQGAVTHYGYDAQDRLTTKTDALGNATHYEYDPAGRLTQVTQPDGSHLGFSYDTYGNLTTEVNELGKVWSYTYDIFRRQVSATDPLGNVTQTQYAGDDLMKNPLQRILPSGRTVLYAYDLAGNLVAQAMGRSTTAFAYDAANQLISVSDPLNRLTRYAYDKRGRLVSSTDPLGRVTKRTYDGANNLLTVTTPGNKLTRNVYDVMNRQSSTTNPKGETTTFAYDAAGNLVSVSDAKGNATQYTYDLDRRKTAIIYPDSSQETFGYDLNNNLVLAHNRAGAALTQQYDLRNRLINSTWSDGTPAVTRSYDAVGRLLTLVSPISALSHAYDDANRLTAETQNLATTLSGNGPATVSYGYDADGNRTSITYPSGLVIQQSYDERNQLTAIAPAGLDPLASYAYDAAGQRTSVALANGTGSSYAYDAAGQMTALLHAVGGNVFAQEIYGYNAMGWRTYTKRLNGLGDVYSYDAVGQVTKTLYDAVNPDTTPSGAASTAGYTYDQVGNRTRVTVDGTAATYKANALNQYTLVAGQSPAYDLAGNLVALGDAQYAYDAQNRMVSATVGTNMVQSFYDARNRCVARQNCIWDQQTSVFILNSAFCLFYDGWNLIEEVQNGGTPTAYVHGPQLDELVAKITATNAVYYHADVLGNVTHLTDDNGNVVEQYKYDVFGHPTILTADSQALTASSVGNRFLFTGREWLAAVGLYDYRNRMYSPTLGRFMQPDPLGFLAGDVNLYRYCGNNPLNFVDSAGLYKDIDDLLKDIDKGNLEGKNLGQMVLKPGEGEKAAEECKAEGWRALLHAIITWLSFLL